MSRQKQSLGFISILKDGKKTNLTRFDFKIPKKEIPLSDMLMCHFSDLGLSTAEKQSFKQEYRKELCYLKSLDSSYLESSCRALLNELSSPQLKNKSLTIKANSYGTFVCLAAIFSGEIPGHVEIKFELDECLLPLFPKSFVKDSGAAHSFPISFRYCEKSWIKPFPSLRRSPKFMSFQRTQDYENCHLKAA